MSATRHPGITGTRPSGKRADLSAQERRDVLNQLFYDGERRKPYLYRFYTLLSLAVAIASFGLLADSTAVVIGAMLVAPLMTPIQAAAASLVMGWGRRQLYTVSLVGTGAIWAIALGYFFAFLTPDRAVLPNEVLARTSPTLLDLAVALAAGAAGAYTLVRKESSAIPGVAVAVALVPPLATVGITLEAGQSDLAARALLLFATNLFAIIAAAAIVLLIVGFTPQALKQRHRAQIRRGFIITGIAVTLITIPLAVHSYNIVTAATERHEIEQAVRDWIGPDNEEFDVLSVDIDGDHIWIDIIGPSEPPGVILLNQSIADRIDKDTIVHVRWVQRNEILMR